MRIESAQNEKIKSLTRLLNKNQERKKQGVFFVEGRQENRRALEYEYEPIEFFICEDYYHDALPNSKINFVSPTIYEKIAYRGSSEGILGIYKVKENKLTDYKPTTNAAVIALEGIEKPGNLGAILRSCEAFGIDALIISDPKVDLYNPNVIRSSVGCLFGLKVYTSTNDELHIFLQENKFQILTTLMDQSSKPLSSKDLTKRSAILFGTEHSGLSPYWQNKGQNTLIPMTGTIDSLNLSNAVAISCYEILRQKMQK